MAIARFSTAQGSAGDSPCWNDDAKSVWHGTGRYKLRPAPGGLALVQDFLNTRAHEVYGPDMLTESASAEEWATQAVQTWSTQRGISCQRPTLKEHDVAKLRELRSVLSEALTSTPFGRLERFFGVVQLTSTDAAEVSWIPKGYGWRWMCAAILAEMMTSRLVGNWQRIKLCRNESCHVAFYDRTWNTSGVWHDAATCGKTMGRSDQPSRYYMGQT